MVEKVAQFKDRFRQAISNSGLTQAEIARRSNIRKQMISDYLKGKYEPKHDRMNRLAKILKVDESWLMGFGDSKNNKEKASNKELLANLNDQRLDELVQGMRSFGGREITESQKEAIKASMKGILKNMDN